MISLTGGGFMYLKLQKAAFSTLNSGWFVSLILMLIFVNIPLSILSNSDNLTQFDLRFIYNSDLIIGIVFSIEYLLRLWTAPLAKEYKGSRIRFALRPDMIIDLLAIIPINMINISILRGFRGLRIFRILKLVQYSDPIKMTLNVFYQKIDALITVGIVMGFFLIVDSFLMYYFEHNLQPQNFGSIMQSIWFCALIFSSAGSDIQPLTSAGKFLEILAALGGIVLFALYSGIFASAFIEARQKEKYPKTKQVNSKTST